MILQSDKVQRTTRKLITSHIHNKMDEKISNKPKKKSLCKSEKYNHNNCSYK